jgi:hypothetical protein
MFKNTEVHNKSLFSIRAHPPFLTSKSPAKRAHPLHPTSKPAPIAEATSHVDLSHASQSLHAQAKDPEILLLERRIPTPLTTTHTTPGLTIGECQKRHFSHTITTHSALLPSDTRICAKRTSLQPVNRELASRSVTESRVRGDQ